MQAIRFPYSLLGSYMAANLKTILEKGISDL